MMVTLDQAGATLLNLIQTAREQVEVNIEAYKRCFSLCESPIEQHFFVTWIDVFRADGFCDDDERPCVQSNWEVEQGYLTLTLYSQYKITLENNSYRADFLLEIHLLPRNRPQGNYHHEHYRIAIELDGHDFHERTKEQAIRDRSRDRAFTRSSYTILRFTGREVYQNAMNVIVEIQNTITDALLPPVIAAESPTVSPLASESVQ
jgi:very-short-patch-repair endonuclease